jgi:hypothetical protein
MKPKYSLAQVVGFVKGERADLLDGNAVVAMDLHFHLHLPQVLHQVVGE